MWHSIDGLNNNYFISKNGIVKNKRNRILKPSNELGYLRFRFSLKGKVKRIYLHRIIAEMFISNPENKSQVNHIDGDKLNNSINNLEWVTPRENMSHLSLSKNKNCKYLGVSYISGMKKFQVSIWIDGKKNYLGSFKTEEQAKEVYDKFVNEKSIKNKYINN